MRKKIVASLTAMFVFSGMGLSAWADEYKTGVVDADVLNVRKSIDDGEVIHKLKKDTPIYIVNEDNSKGLWYQVKYNETQYAWVSGEYVQIKSGFVNGKVIKNKCNIRTQPNREAEVKTRFDSGKELQIISKEGEWYKIAFEEGEAYIHDTLVQITDEMALVSGEEVTRGQSAHSDVISIAKAKLGAKYVYGSNGPKTYDCSSYTQYVYKNAYGISLPRTSKAQSQTGEKVSKSNLQIGDLVFFDTSKDGRVNHVGVYIGNGDFIHASSGTGRKVKISPLDTGFYNGVFKFARRVK